MNAKSLQRDIVTRMLVKFKGLFKKQVSQTEHEFRNFNGSMLLDAPLNIR
jgi:hypothetical protein